MKKLDRSELVGLSMVEQFREITKINLDQKLAYVLILLGVCGLTTANELWKIANDFPNVSQPFGTSTTINKGDVSIYSWVAMEKEALLLFSVKYKSQIIVVHTAEEMIIHFFCNTGQGPGDPILRYTEKLIQGHD